MNKIGTSGKTLSRAHASTKANDHLNLANATVTCEIKLFQNYFSLRRSTTGIILFQRVETCLKLLPSYYGGFTAHEYVPAFCLMLLK